MTNTPASIPGDSPSPLDRLGHPPGLFICFLTEMWERFSYYGMRALLIFYLTDHFLFSDQEAGAIFGAYISLVYITPVIGGLVADRYLGHAKAVVLGAILLVCGHFGMAIEGPAPLPAEAATRNWDVYQQIFYLSLAFIIMGVGFIKASISTIVGTLYPQADRRRDAAYTLFYMGINVGAFLGAIICGLLLEFYGFRYGFGAAGVGMLLGLLVFLRGKHLFMGRADPPKPEVLRTKLAPGLSVEHFIYLASLLGVVLCWVLIQNHQWVGGLLAGSLICAMAGLIGYSVLRLDSVTRDKMLVCLFLMGHQIIFWALFEQSGSSLNLMTERNVDRVVLGQEIPAALFQSANAAFIILLAPLIGALWTRLARYGWEPSIPTKFALALIQVGLGFLCLVYGANHAEDPLAVSLIWLLLLYFLHTTGELCLSPIGLSMTTRLSAPHIIGLMMGTWFLVSAAGNYVSGWLAGLSGAERMADGSIDATTALFGYVKVYGTVGWISVGAGAIALLLVPLLKKAMHGVH